MSLLELRQLPLSTGRRAGSPATCVRWGRCSSALGKVTPVAVGCWMTPAGKLPLLRAGTLAGGNCATRTELSGFFTVADLHIDSC